MENHHVARGNAPQFDQRVAPTAFDVAASTASLPLDYSSYSSSHQPPPHSRLHSHSPSIQSKTVASQPPPPAPPPLQTDLTRSDAQHGVYSQQMMDSPRATSSDDSMLDPNETTPPASPPIIDSPGTTADQFAQLSVDRGKAHSEALPLHRGRDREKMPSLKRSPSSELSRSAGDQSPEPGGLRMAAFAGVRSSRGNSRHQHHHHQRRLPLPSSVSRLQMYHHPAATRVPGRLANSTAPQAKLPLPLPVPRDSGYESIVSKAHTLQPSSLSPSVPNPPSTLSLEAMQGHTVQRHNGLIQLPANGRYPGLILQPDSCPISQEQLAAEVKGIYAGLVMVEAKCINMDATQAANPNSHLGPGQWQALIALHRTLLYEHHDFLMATQHPSASDALRGLAAKYSMPARMWKHGIHAFLEVLRHRRPDSQDYMLAFIYLAYQMMALLFETVPSFTDTWIECLGDLARYRMAIEEEKEPHATWGSVAARWYMMASDRHPAIGRLYHHLGILERPSLRKLCLYAKSLTCVIPFPNARDSLATLCAPIVQDEEAIRSSSQNMEARVVTFYALVYTGHHTTMTEKVAADALELIGNQPAKLKDNAAYLASTIIAHLLELGSPTNALWQVYANAINHTIQNSRATATSTTTSPWQPSSPTLQMTPALSFGMQFCSACFNLLIRREDDRARLNTVLPFAYVMLVWLHGLYMVRTRLVSCGVSLDTFAHLVEPTGLSWAGLAEFLNSLAHYEPIHPYLLDYARHGIFPAKPKTPSARPLAEDYLIRGAMWCQFYFPQGWFDEQTEDDGRAIETPYMQKARLGRVQWLGLFLAFNTDYIQYDLQSKQFSASTTAVATAAAAAADPQCSTSSTTPSPVVSTADSAAFSVDRPSESGSPTMRSPKAQSSSSQSEDGFTIVKKSAVPLSYASIAATTKQVSTTPPSKTPRRAVPNFKVFDEESIAMAMDDGQDGYQ